MTALPWNEQLTAELLRVMDTTRISGINPIQECTGDLALAVEQLRDGFGKPLTNSQKCCNRYSGSRRRTNEVLGFVDTARTFVFGDLRIRA
jgi:hypothetical protein